MKQDQEQYQDHIQDQDVDLNQGLDMDRVEDQKQDLMKVQVPVSEPAQDHK